MFRALFLILWVFILLFPNSSGATQITLGWKPSTSTDVRGYIIHYGSASNNYQWQTNVGNTNEGTISSLVQGKTYYFSVTSYNSTQVESLFSNEVAFSVPAPLPSQYSLTVNQTGSGLGTVTASPPGTSFYAGTTVTLTATPGARSSFAGWSGACSGASPVCTITLNANAQATAVFNVNSPSPSPDFPSTDFRANGHADIFWQHQTRGEVFVWYMNGATFVSDQRIAVMEDLNWKVAGIADFNGDGKPDILWHHQTRGDVYVWFMDGPNFVRDQYIRTVEDVNWKISGIGDFNGDGKPDILWHHQTRGDVYVWFMDGPTFVRDQYVRTVGDDLNWKIAGVGDFDGDGKPEILWHHQTRGEVYIWFLDGTTFLYDRYVRTVGDDLNWKIEGVGDFNGDGKADILWRHQLRGDVYVWFMDGANFVSDQYIRSVNRTPDDLNWRIVN